MKEELSAAKINLETKVSRHIYSVHNNEIHCVYKYTTCSFRNKHFRGVCFTYQVAQCEETCSGPFWIKNVSINILPPIDLTLGAVSGQAEFRGHTLFQHPAACYSTFLQCAEHILGCPMPFINGLSQKIYGKIPCIYFTGSWVIYWRSYREFTVKAYKP